MFGCPSAVNVWSCGTSIKVHNLKKCNMNIETWKTVAKDRSLWHASIHSSIHIDSASFEIDHISLVIDEFKINCFFVVVLNPSNI